MILWGQPRLCLHLPLTIAPPFVSSSDQSTGKAPLPYTRKQHGLSFRGDAGHAAEVYSSGSTFTHQLTLPNQVQIM
jgi:hypothetical protein